MKKLTLYTTLFIFLFSSCLFAQNLTDHESVWEGHDGQQYTTSDFVKMPYKVVTMIFTSCPSACPLMVKHLKQLDAKLSSGTKDKVIYLLFSIDPNDTREKLSKFHTSMELDERYILLRNKNEQTIRELAMLLGFQYKKVSDSMYSHSTNVFLFDQNNDLKANVSQSYKAFTLAEKF